MQTGQSCEGDDASSLRDSTCDWRVLGLGYGRRAKTSGGTFRIDSYAPSIGSPLGPFWAEGAGLI